MTSTAHPSEAREIVRRGMPATFMPHTLAGIIHQGRAAAVKRPPAPCARSFPFPFPFPFPDPCPVLRTVVTQLASESRASPMEAGGRKVAGSAGFSSAEGLRRQQPSGDASPKRVPRVAGCEMKPDPTGSAMDADTNLEQAQPEGIHLGMCQLGAASSTAEHVHQDVGGTMQEQSKLVGPEAMAAQAI